MKNYIFIFVALILCSWTTSAFGQAKNSEDFNVRFDLDMDSDHLVIKPMCLNKTNTDSVLRYKLEVKGLIRGKIDRKPSTQSGIFELLPKEEKPVCTMEVRIQRAEGYQIDLYLYKSGSQIGVYSISRPSSM